MVRKTDIGRVLALLLILAACRFTLPSTEIPSTGLETPSTLQTASDDTPPASSRAPSWTPDSSRTIHPLVRSTPVNTPTPRPEPTPFGRAAGILFNTLRCPAEDPCLKQPAVLLQPETASRQPITQPGDSLQAVSPDGRRLLVSQGTNLSVMELGSGKQTLLSRAFAPNPLGYSDMAYFLPDGERIVFIGDKKGQYTIYLTLADGSQLQQLTSGGSNPLFLYPTYGADGVYWERGVLNALGTSLLGSWFTPLDGGRQTAIKDIRPFIFSQDGLKMVYWKFGDPGSLNIVSLNQADERVLYTARYGEYPSAVAISPDAGQIFLSICPDAQCQKAWLYLVSSDGMAVQPLALDAVILEAAWSPDGAEILLLDDRSRVWMLNAYSGKEHSLQELLNLPAGEYVENIAWLPLPPKVSQPEPAGLNSGAQITH